MSTPANALNAGNIAGSPQMGLIYSSGLACQCRPITFLGIVYGDALNNIRSTAAGATGTVLQGGGGFAPSFSTATFPSTATANDLLYASSTNTWSSLAGSNNGVLISSNSGAPSWLAAGTTGQVLTATTGSPATWAAATSGFAWADKSTAFNAVASNGYFVTGTTTATLPASPSEGDTIKFIVDDTLITTITANTGQKIRIGSVLSAAAGTAVNTARGDSVSLIYRTTGTTWMAEAVIGTWTVT